MNSKEETVMRFTRFILPLLAPALGLAMSAAGAEPGLKIEDVLKKERNQEP